MGLIERRMIKLGRKEWVPAAQKQVEELTTSKAAIEVEWETFESDEEALKNLQNQGLGRLMNAFRMVCRDELGKEAARDGIQRIQVRNVATPAEKSFTLADGTLKLQAAYGKGGDGYFSDNELARALERML